MNQAKGEPIQASSNATPIMPFSEFLTNIPPNTEANVDLPTYTYNGQFEDQIRIKMPEIELHCANIKCSGIRVFRSVNEHQFRKNRDAFFEFKCSNCGHTRKTYALRFGEFKSDTMISITKLGEMPIFGQPTPARVISLIGPDRELFLKGRRCENFALGIGAFVYYRRVIEQQKNRIIDEIIKAIKKTEPESKSIPVLEKARRETQFTTAMDAIKDVLPNSLYVNGANPLQLLHTALSQGVHELTDEECLQIAHSIRVVLIEFSERLSEILKNNKELNAAVSKLNLIKQMRTQSPNK